MRASLAVAAIFGLAGAASAESALRIPNWIELGETAATTYDEGGSKVGPASLIIERLDTGRIRIEGISGFERAPRTVVTAVLEPTPDGEALRPVLQDSRSHDEDGRPLGVLRIDHVNAEGTCTPPDGGEVRRLALPVEDRVANVVISQLLGPLVAAREGRFEFSLFICRPDIRILSARAEVVGTKVGPEGEDLIEVQTGVDLGPVLGRLLSPFLPRVSIWFDPDDTRSWIGQRMPLFGKGPTVVVLRSDVSPSAVLDR